MSQKTELKPLVLNPGAGRAYAMGRMSAVFKADLEETDSTLSVSEWWLEPNTEGPHIHKHPEAHLFYVIEGNLAVYLSISREEAGLRPREARTSISPVELNIALKIEAMTPSV